jgi:hypothetical protein
MQKKREISFDAQKNPDVPDPFRQATMKVGLPTIMTKIQVNLPS